MNTKKAIAVFVLLAVAGLGLSAYMAESNVSVAVSDREVSISPSTSTVHTYADDYTTKNLTVSTTSDKTITVRLKAMPDDYQTAKVWGKDFVAVISPSEVKINSSHEVKVTLITHSEKAGSYKVKVIAVK